MDVASLPLRPALVAGADTPTGLAVARALSAHGVRVVGAAAEPDAPTCHSAHWREIVPVTGHDAADWLAAVRNAITTYGRMVLIIADDAVVRIVAHHRDAFDELVDLVLPSTDAVETLLDKTRFHAWAVANGFPVPHTEVVNDAAELAAALTRMTFPVVLKPFERTAAWQEVSKRDKVHRLESAADLDALPFAPFDVADRFVVQEWIPGLDSDVWFCLTYRDHAGAEVASQVGRKITQWPVDTGSSALAVTAHDTRLHALTHRLLDTAGHVGLGSLEIRRSSRDGRMYITEPTVGRPNLQTALATAAGVDLLLAAYRDACGLPTLPAGTTRPALWVHESGFPRSLLVAAARRRLDVRAVLGALLSRRARTGAFGTRADREPLRQEARRIVRKAMGKSPQPTGARRSLAAV